MKRTLLSALLLSTVALTGAAEAGQLKANMFTLQIDCYDSRVDDTGTKNTLTVGFHTPVGQVSTTSTSWTTRDMILSSSVSPKCNSVVDAVYKSDVLGIPAGLPQFITIRTSGSDAFWMDEIRLYRHSMTIHIDPNTGRRTSTFDQKKFLLAHWGRDGGKGYCLSTDRDDGFGAWSAYVDRRGCSTAFKLVVNGSKAYYMR